MRRAFAITLGLTLFACASSGGSPPAAQAPDRACRMGDVERTLQAQPSAAVILILVDSAGDLRVRQARVLGELGAEFQLERRYDSIPGMAGTITRAGYAQASKHADVRCVQFDGSGGGG